MKTLGRTWFSQLGAPTIMGIVLVEFNEIECRAYGIDRGNRAAYIGSGAGGDTEEQDILHIVQTGAKFPVSVAEHLAGLK